MEVLFDPNVAYLILVLGLVFSVLALFTPGTGILEVGALFAIFLAGYAVYKLPFHWWALILLLVGIVPFLIALRKTRKWYWLIPALLSIVVGTVFLFKTETGAPAINPFFATVVSLMVIAFLWLVGRKSLEAMKMRPSQDLSRLIDKVGEARTDVFRDGTVYVGSEEWTARSEQFIPAGNLVKVIAREGLVLVVAPVEKQ